jgi:hypothetical protein
VRQFEGALSPLLAPPLPALPNAQMAWAALAVEELTRLGVATFAVAPGECGLDLHMLGLTQLGRALTHRSPPPPLLQVRARRRWLWLLLPTRAAS